METATLIKNAELVRQSYGIAMSQVRYGGPRGIWLECTGCEVSHVIKGSAPSDSPWAKVSDGDAVKVFRNHGWTGEGPRMLKAKCPKCSKPPVA